MFVELIYDKRNVAEFPNARELILAELEKRVNRVFPAAEVRVKPMVTNSSINTDASKGDKAKLAAVIEEMFEEAEMWLANDI
ncbi:DinI-like family protein [uncultured Erwinia sp.]|uniref:DinI-like family protein n=1 Tax=uncultured Erwinia sp. TaxID=246798 RepID=UPI002582ACAD|nr:DinI-like family protein [uncultured Erwinia sp.]